jgi:hypothetical protein
VVASRDTQLVRLKLEGRLPRSPPISPKLSFAENPAFPGGVFFLGGAELTDQACLEGGRSTGVSGVALHSFQNGMVSVRVPGATAPSRSAGAKRSSPPRSPAGTRIVQLEHGESEVEPTERG